MQTRTGTRTVTVRLAIVCAMVATITIMVGTAAMTYQASATPRPAQAMPVVADPQVQVTLRALHRLHMYGYSVDTAARADRAIKSWQRSNGLAADGVVSAATIRSLGLSAPVVRVVRSAKPATVRPSAPVAPGVADRGPSGGDVEAIIRDVWPDDLEDHAVAIAFRESRLQPAVINANHNATGLFQIMWTVHRSWLCPQLGVCAQSDLQDARTNATAALALYRRDGGWGPWRL